MFVISTADLVRMKFGSITRGCFYRDPNTLYDLVCTLDDIAACEEKILTISDRGFVPYLRSEIETMHRDADEIRATFC